MEMIFDIVDPAELTQYIRRFEHEVLRPEALWTLDRWLPNQFTEDLEFKIRKGGFQDVDAAEFRAWDTPAKMAGRPGTRRISGAIAPINRMIPMGEEETIRTQALDRGTDDPIINAIYDDAERMIRSVHARIELARGDLIDDGIITINENGLSFSVDWGRSAAMSPTAAMDWDNPAATILTEILGLLEDYVDTNGVEPAALSLPKWVRSALALNTEFRDYAANNGTTPSRLNNRQVDEVVADEGLPPLIWHNEQVRVNGVATKTLSQEKAYFMPQEGDAFGNTWFGVTAEALKLRSLGLITREETPGTVAVAFTQEHPVATFTLGAATALPGTPNPDLVMDITIRT